jgi:hypothetical protein
VEPVATAPIESTPTGEFEDPLEERDYQEAVKLLLNPPKVRQKTVFLLVTLGIFVALSMMRGSSSVLDLAMLVGVLFVHELGHAISMRAFGYSDVRIFFAPPLRPLSRVSGARAAARLPAASSPASCSASPGSMAR